MQDAADFQNKMDGYRFPNSGSAKASLHCFLNADWLRCTHDDLKACIVVPAHVQASHLCIALIR